MTTTFFIHTSEYINHELLEQGFRVIENRRISNGVYNICASHTDYQVVIDFLLSIDITQPTDCILT